MRTGGIQKITSHSHLWVDSSCVDKPIIEKKSVKLAGGPCHVAETGQRAARVEVILRRFSTAAHRHEPKILSPRCRRERASHRTAHHRLARRSVRIATRHERWYHFLSGRTLTSSRAKAREPHTASGLPSHSLRLRGKATLSRAKLRRASSLRAMGVATLSTRLYIAAAAGARVLLSMNHSCR